MTPPFVDVAHIRRLADDGAYTRGAAYFADGAVLQVTWDPASSVIESLVAGSGERNYRCRIRLDPHRPERLIAATSCTCPLQFDCKHAVATLLAANRLAESTPAPAASWRSVLASTDAAPR
uniref:SWIM zinc finger family protein n=1 Tax=Microbacterium sp. CPCC 204701 TaxID=2493084 RepID=UPI001F0C9791